MSSVPGFSVRSPGGSFVKRGAVPPVSMPRSRFDLSRGHKTSLDSGLVVPLYCEEVLPGDTFRVSATVLARLATLQFPLMDNLFMDIHWFFCPWRLVWSNAEKFFGQQDNPADSVSYTLPQFNTFTPTLTAAPMDLADYFGINLFVAPLQNVQFNSMQFRAYALIWNKWYRDENLQNSVVVPLTDGPDTYASLAAVLPRGKRGDRFTLALPWPQKGSTAVSFLPAGMPVIPNANPTNPTWKQASGSPNATTLRTQAAGANPQVQVTGTWALNDVLKWDSPNLMVDPTLATINAFRQANAMQVYLERQARGGTRYVEYLKSQWGVTSSDARLQRPEYLGGASAPVVISPVAQVSAKDPGTNSLGDLGGIGAVSHHGSGLVRSFEEHGFLFGMVSIRADLNYQRGVPRQFKRRTVFDVANPAFAHIGEQPIYNYEVWYNGEGADNPTGVFGYEERFNEYKTSYSMLTGNMRSLSSTSYDVWHVAQEFGALPTLGDTFIRENPAVDRVIATPFTDQWILDSVFSVQVARCLPVYGVPGLGSHL